MGFPHVSDEALSPHPTQGRPFEPTLLVLDADPPPRLESLAGRARVLHADAASLASLLPEADVLLVWDFLSDAVREAWPGGGGGGAGGGPPPPPRPPPRPPPPAGCTPRAPARTG